MLLLGRGPSRREGKIVGAGHRLDHCRRVGCADTKGPRRDDSGSGSHPPDGNPTLDLSSPRTRHFSCPSAPPLPSLATSPPLQGLPSASRVPSSAGATRRSSHGGGTLSACSSSTTVCLPVPTQKLAPSVCF